MNEEYQLSVILPSRNEEFLVNTIEDLLKNKRGKTQIIVGLDGSWPTEPIKDHPDVVILHYPESIGQRSITKQCIRLSKAKYIAKTDAHCSFDEGFDVKMLDAFKEVGDDVVMAPLMKNLWVFDWVCSDGHRRYQGPSGLCKEMIDGKECGKETHKEIMWIAKNNPQSTSYCFDSEPHFQYNNEYKKRQVGDIVETMSLQGSFFMMTREKYFKLDIDDEAFGSWGSQGIEIAAKFWTSGGRVLVNKKSWYAHCFRTQGSDFGFPYELSGRQTENAKKMAKDLFFNNKWEKQVKNLSWLVEKFWPVPGWKQKDLDMLKKNDKFKSSSKAILYYTNNRINMRLGKKVRDQLQKSGLPITSVSLKPLDFGRNIHYKGESSYATMFKQILTGLEAMTEDVIFFSENDVMYHPDHFQFTPPKKDIFYYNGNYWMLRLKDGFAVHYNVSPLSGLVAYREILLTHFRERVKMIEELGDKYEPLKMGFEPFTHKRIPWKTWYEYKLFMPENPNIDITHDGNATWKRWKQEDFRRKPTFWKESMNFSIPGWNDLKSLSR